MKILNILALVLSLATPALAQTATTTTAPAANVLGTWDVSVNTSQGVTNAQLKLKKDGDKLGGTIASQMGEVPVEAEIKGKAVSLWFNINGQSGPMAIEMAGTVEGDAIKGTMAVGGQTAGDWTATRAKDATATDTTKAPTTAQPAGAAKGDLSGNYGVTVELPNMTATPTMVLKQDGEKLTGDYVSAQYGKFPITGTVKGADVTFSFAMNIEGNGMTVTYTGKTDKDGAIKGSVAYGDMMSGTFVATKSK